MPTRYRLREILDERGMSAGELAARAGVHKTTISRLERGRQEATPATLDRLAATLGVTPKELIEKPRPTNRLKELREARGWSREDLARRAGLGVATIARLEDGLSDLLPRTAERLAAILGVRPEDLVADGDQS